MLSERRAVPTTVACAELGIDLLAFDEMYRSALERGVAIERTGDLVRLERPLFLIDAAALETSIRQAVPTKLHSFVLLPEVGSTNAYLMEQARTGLPDGVVCLAEYQTAGRGRRGRPWFGQYGCSVLVSIHWTFPRGARLEGLSLAVGVGVARALRECGIVDLGLKWPNDVYVDGRKAAGILIESGQKGVMGWFTVSGIGINVSKPARMSKEIGQPWIALDERAELPVDRQAVAASIIGHVLAILDGYAVTGLDGLREEWSALDLSAGQEVEVTAGRVVTQGIGCGIDRDGFFRLDVGGEIRTFNSAEVSLRVSSTVANRAAPEGKNV